MSYSTAEVKMLKKANEIGMDLDQKSDENLNFLVSSPVLDPLMAFLKKLKPEDMGQVFYDYEGVMKIMRFIEDSAQKFEKEMETN
jgi:hypothetical protein